MSTCNQLFRVPMVKVTASLLILVSMYLHILLVFLLTLSFTFCSTFCFLHEHVKNFSTHRQSSTSTQQKGRDTGRRSQAEEQQPLPGAPGKHYGGAYLAWGWGRRRSHAPIPHSGGSGGGTRVYKDRVFSKMGGGVHLQFW